MKVAIMQPYFFPYLGYFQLIHSVDKFVFLDDVNFIKKGWINRNNICLNGLAHLISIPLVKVSQNKLINEIDVFLEEKEIKNIQQTIKIAYSKSKHYNVIEALIEKSLFGKEKNIAEINKMGIISTCQILDFQTEFIHSSSVFNNKHLKGEERIIDICLQLNASTYINPIGGIEIYNKENFNKVGIDIQFIRKQKIAYSQLSKEFIDNLSILDTIANIDTKMIIEQYINKKQYE